MDWRRAKGVVATDPAGSDPGALYEHAPCGLLLTDDDGLVLRANATFCDWLGVARAALVGKRRFQDLLTVGGRIFHQTQWMPLLRMQGSVAEVKLDIARDGDRPLPMVMNAIRRERDGAMVHEIALFVAKDRHAYERELLAARKRAEELATQQRSAREFAEQMMAIVSHDLRTPLGTIRMAGEVLQKLELPARYRALPGNIERATDRALALINDLLDLTRGRLGQGIAITRQAIDLHDIVAAHVAELALAYPDARIEHRRQGDRRCEADPARLGQLVGNLVSNAVAYGRPGAPVVVSTATDDGECVISVRNEGEPIADALQGALFQPMVRGTDAGAAARSVGWVCTSSPRSPTPTAAPPASRRAPSRAPSSSRASRGGQLGKPRPDRGGLQRRGPRLPHRNEGANPLPGPARTMTSDLLTTPVVVCMMTTRVVRRDEDATQDHR